MRLLATCGTFASFDSFRSKTSFVRNDIQASFHHASFWCKATHRVRSGMIDQRVPHDVSGSWLQRDFVVGWNVCGNYHERERERERNQGRNKTNNNDHTSAVWSSRITEKVIGVMVMFLFLFLVLRVRVFECLLLWLTCRWKLVQCSFFVSCQARWSVVWCGDRDNNALYVNSTKNSGPRRETTVLLVQFFDAVTSRDSLPLPFGDIRFVLLLYHCYYLLTSRSV